MNGLTKTILSLPHTWRIPDVLQIEDRWMIEEYGSEGETATAFWVSLWDGKWGPRVCRPLLRWMGRRWEKRIEREGVPTGRFFNRPRHVCFLSEYLRALHQEARIELPSSEVIYGGMPTVEFYEPVRGQRDISEPLRILYAGQVTPDRGLHTAIEALGHMDCILRSQLTLSVAGDGPPDYLERLKTEVEALGLTDCVSFLGKVPHGQMAKIYREHDVLIFTSTRQEGLGFVMVEAMLAGCAVITTGSGGAMEIAALADLPLFPKGDSEALKDLLARLVTHRREVSEIASRGQEVALREFNFDRMIGRLVATLKRVRMNKLGSEAQ
jgi:glycosyltransferase involved in cell wall biosynthesis